MEFSYSGLDELVQQLDHLDKDVEGTLNEALEAGAAAVTDAWQEEARARGHVDTGDMVNAIRPTRPWKTKSDVRGIAIYPQGKDRHGIRIGGRIRRLTPLEYWRLQGFTDEQFAKLAPGNFGDRRLYQMAGNAVTVTVIQAIAEWLLQIFDEMEAT